MPELDIQLKNLNPEHWKKQHAYIYAVDKEVAIISPSSVKDLKKKSLSQRKIRCYRVEENITFEIPDDFFKFYFQEETTIDLGVSEDKTDVLIISKDNQAIEETL